MYNKFNGWHLSVKSEYSYEAGEYIYTLICKNEKRAFGIKFDVNEYKEESTKILEKMYDAFVIASLLQHSDELKKTFMEEVHKTLVCKYYANFNRKITPDIKEEKTKPGVMDEVFRDKARLDEITKEALEIHKKYNKSFLSIFS